MEGRGPLNAAIVAAFDVLPAQLQTAARYMLDRPDDVALLSMREQARRAGVPPATMTRLAKRLGLDGYDSVRQLYAGAVRAGTLGFAGKAVAQVEAQKLRGEQALDLRSCGFRLLGALAQGHALRTVGDDHRHIGQGCALLFHQQRSGQREDQDRKGKSTRPGAPCAHIKGISGEKQRHHRQRGQQRHRNDGRESQPSHRSFPSRCNRAGACTTSVL